MNEFVISVSNLSKDFGKLKAVQDVTMSVKRGQVHGFLGPNGSGKTTAMRMMCGLLKPSSGDVSVLGMEVPKDAEEVRKNVGYMTQRFSLYEDLSVLENLLFLCRIHGFSKSERSQRISEVLRQLQLQPLQDQRVGPMSGGQKRRIALAAAILTKPQLLILDEPTSEVDPNTRREMWTHFFELAEQGVSLLISTHLMDEAERCHCLTIMNNGKVVANGSVEYLKKHLPSSVYEITGSSVTPLVPKLSQIEGIIAVNQVGLSLRVLVQSTSVIKKMKPFLSDTMHLSLVNASVEDVFVHATIGEKRA